MKQIKTDGDLVRVAQQIDNHLDAIRNLVLDLEEAEHPYAGGFLESLSMNNLTAFAWARHIVSHSLLHPERWETGNFGIRHKKGKE
jgi:hypothetical protein